MDTEQLKTFLEVSRTRHFGKAAQTLYLSQSAVSSRIKALEDQLGTPLFVRNRNDIQLTPAGNRLLNHAENILAAWGRAKHDVALEDDASTSMAIAGTPSLWDIAIQEWLYALHENQAELAIHSEVLSSDAIARRLMEGTLDLGFTFEPPQLPQIEVKKIAPIPLIMVCTQPNLSSEEAIALGYVSVDWGVAFAITHARLFPELHTPAIHLPLGSIARDYLLNCGGSAYLAEPTVEEAISDERLFRVADAPVIERPAYVIYSAEMEQPNNVKSALRLFGNN